MRLGYGSLQGQGRYSHRKSLSTGHGWLFLYWFALQLYTLSVFLFSATIIRASCLFSLLCECLIRVLNQDFFIVSPILIVLLSLS